MNPILSRLRHSIATSPLLLALACGEGSLETVPLASGPAAETTNELVAAAGQSVATGSGHTCVIIEGGAVKCWGANDQGQLGLEHLSALGNAPDEMGNGLPSVSLGRGLVAKALAFGNEHSCALFTTGQVKCWGYGVLGQLGRGSTVNWGGEPGQMGDNLPVVDLGTGRTATAIDAYENTTCAVLDTGQVKCWGSNKNGGLGLGHVRHLGRFPGEMGDALPAVFLGVGRTATAVAVGALFTCALLDTKDVKCWGYNGLGQLGQGHVNDVGDGASEMESLQPVQLGTDGGGNPLKAKSIVVGGAFACALIEGTNQAKCWGTSQYGQLGIGSASNWGDAPGEMGDALPHVFLGANVNAKALTAGREHACAQLDAPLNPVNTNQLKCWGRNQFGQLGHGNVTSRGLSPLDMGDNLPLSDLGAGRSMRVFDAFNQTCVVLDTNQVKCWGENSDGELGLGDVNHRGDQPNEMGLMLPRVDLGSRGVTSATVGTSFACVRLANGQLKCWGANSAGQLGLGDTAVRGEDMAQMGDALPAVSLGTNRSVYSGAGPVIDAGNQHTCAVLDNRSVKCWGNGALGRLGLGDVTTRGDGAGEMGDALPAVSLGTGKLVNQIAAGYEHNCALLSTNDVKCWGNNAHGNLGLGDTLPRGDGPGEMGDTLPLVNLGTGRKASSIGAGSSFNCALLTAPVQVKCWGSNSKGQLGLGDFNNRGDAANEMGDALPVVDVGGTPKALSVGLVHACVLLTTNQVKCWGANNAGQLGQGDLAHRGDGPGEMGASLPIIPLGTGRTAKAVYAGTTTTCVLLDTNQLKCWGENDAGQLGLGDTRRRGVRVGEMGDYLETLFLGAGRTVLSVVPAMGGSSQCAVLDSKEIKCWGGNINGALGLGGIDNRGDAPNEMGDFLPPVDLGQEI